MNLTTEKDWTTKAGLRAVVVLNHWKSSYIRDNRCGYVNVPKEHSLFKVAYGDNHPSLKRFSKANFPLGKRGVMLAITATVGAEEGDVCRCSPDVAFDVHGGLTYSGCGVAPMKEGEWWFGYDCGHCDDNPEIQDTAYCVAECESLAEQIAAIK